MSPQDSSRLLREARLPDACRALLARALTAWTIKMEGNLMSPRSAQEAEQIEALLGRYLDQRLVRGVIPDPEELCRESPELLGPLRECIREYERLNRLLAPPEGLAPGRALLHYRIVDKLGAGGMGQVYLAEDTKLSRQVALKVLSPEMAEDEERLDRFRREARIVAALNHPNIVTIHSVEETEDLPFITMELVEGKTLAELIPEGGMSHDELLETAIPLAEAVSAAHEKGITHRDVKPANVMVSESGRVKVLDFGLAKLQPLATPLAGSDAASGDLTTEAGRLLGTVPYMSPEQLQGKTVDPRSDVFALGIVLYEMSTGRRPFAGESAADVISAILRDAPVSLAELRADLPVDLGRITERCLEKDPQRRYPTAHHLRDALAELKRQMESGEAIPPPARTAIRRVKRPTVGRDKERAELRAGLEAAAAGHGLLMCVAGEPGIGKTTLVEDFLDEVNVAGPPCTIARGRCSERLAGTEAYLPFLEVMESLVKSPADGMVAGRVMRQAAPWWYVQVASLSTDDPSDLRLIEAVRNTTQERMKRELAAFLQELSQVQPVVFFFDDLHWSDVSTVDLLSFLAGRFDTMRLLVVGSYRPEEMLLGEHPFLQIRPDLQARGLCREIAVDFLSRGEIEDYLALLFPGHDFPADFPALIHSRTEGSPLFMVDMVRYLRDRGVIVEKEGRWALSQSLPDIRLELPESVRSMIQRKIGRLAADDRRLLTAAGVQGNEFDTAVVGQVLGMDEEEIEERLQVLDRDHELVRFLEEQEFPDRTLTLRYRFVHVLYQNELYAALTRTKQARLSKAAAEALLGFYGEQSGPVASELAVLFEVARDFVRATHYSCLAAQNALQVFAYQEAIVLANRGLELLKNLPDTPEAAGQELELQIALGLALMSTRGYASPDVEQNNARKQDLIQKLGQTPQLFPAVWGVWVFYYIKGDLPTALDQAEQLFGLAQHEGDVTLLLLAHHALALTLIYRGELVSTKMHLEEVLRLYDPQQHRPLAYLYGSGDVKVNALMHYSWDLWLLGYPDQALERIREGLGLARELSQPYSLAHVLVYASIFHQYRSEVGAVREYADEVITLCTEHGFPFWLAGGIVQRGWALAQAGQIEEGIVRMQEGLTAFHATGAGIAVPYQLTLLAEVYEKVGQTEKALTTLAEAFTVLNKNEDRFFEAEVHRLEGELRQEQGAAEAEVEGCFRQACEVARRQEAKSLELRAGMSLSRLWQKQGKREEARGMLSEIYGWFTEGLNTADLKAAEALLEELSSDEK